jgi:acyl carrier protein
MPAWFSGAIGRSLGGNTLASPDFGEVGQGPNHRRGAERMDRAEVMDRVVKILTPWVKDEAALAKVSMETNILEDLKVNSARLVDVVIAFEDDFDIEIADEDVDRVNTVGDAVNLISGKL